MRSILLTYIGLIFSNSLCCYSFKESTAFSTQEEQVSCMWSGLVFFFSSGTKSFAFFLAVCNEITETNALSMGVSRTALAIYSFVSNTKCVAWEVKLGSTNGTNFPG